MQSKLIILFLLFYPLFSSASETPLITVENTESELDTVVIQWNEIYNRPNKVFEYDKKITSESPMTLKVKSFNFVRYNLEFNIQEDTLVQYKNLEKLWSESISVFQGKLGGAFEAGPDSFLKRIDKWQSQLNSASAALTDVLTNPGNLTFITNEIFLTSDDSLKLMTNIRNFNITIENLEGLKASAYQGILMDPHGSASFDNLISEARKQDSVQFTVQYKGTVNFNSTQGAFYANELYKSTLIAHEQVIEKLKSFISLANQSVNGLYKVIEKKESGIKVTVTMIPKAYDKKNDTRTNKQAVTFKYFVSSTLPLIYHVGPVYTHLHDNKIYEILREVQGKDFFKQIDKPNSSTELVVFLSYELPFNTNGESSFLFSIGTSVASPGKQVYLGGGFKLFKYFIVNVGGYTLEVDEGVNFINNDLFESIQKTRKWGGFLGISLSPF